MIPIFELIQVAIGNRDVLSRVPSAEEWGMLYNSAMMQAVTGVCFSGVQRLQKEMKPPREILLRWLVLAESVRKRNMLLNERAKELTERFAEGGFRSCVLKGQGIAELYSDCESKFTNAILSDEISISGGVAGKEHFPLGFYRQSGDIDIWVDGERKVVLDYAHSFGEVKSVDFKHTDFRCFDDVEVEVHSTPTWFYSPINYRRFKKWLVAVRDHQFEVGKFGFAAPTISFNLVYSLIHIYKHLFDEGVGLRQLMDYYFILLHSSAAERDSAYKTLCSFGMSRFVAATMFVMKEVFSMEDVFLLCVPSEAFGRRFLRIVVDGGNFGRYDKRNRHGKENAIQKGLRNIQHNMRIVFDYPSEVLWAPLWKIWHFVWRKLKGYQ